MGRDHNRSQHPAATASGEVLPVVTRADLLPPLTGGQGLGFGPTALTYRDAP